MRIPLDDRARLGLLLLSFAAGLASMSARAITLPPQPVSEVQLVKAPHEGLHFQWQASVAEDGGLFILARRGERRAQMIQSASSRRRNYEVSWRAPAASGAYELRYSGADGRVIVLATLLVNCQTLDTRQATDGVTSHARQPLVAPPLPARPEQAQALHLAEPAHQRRALLRAPPVPPPRAKLRVA